MKISTEVLAIIDQASISGNALTLTGQLDRKLYAAVAKIIELAGGKWNRKAAAHLFDDDAALAIEPILLTGEIGNRRQDFGQFDTPADIAHQVVDLARIDAGMSVLEPSAGIGNLVEEIERAGGRVEAFEIDSKRLHKAKDRCLLAGGIRLSDFLAAKPEPVFDCVVMNPPFAGQADIRHVMHAARFLRPDGRLVAIMSAGVTFRQTRLTLDFHEFLAAHGGEIRPLPEGAFLSSGTAINTVVVSLDARQ